MLYKGAVLMYDASGMSGSHLRKESRALEELAPRVDTVHRQIWR